MIIGEFFAAAWPWILGALRSIVIVAIAMLVLWLVLGRGKDGERRMTGLLRTMSVFKGTNTPGNGSGTGGTR